MPLRSPFTSVTCALSMAMSVPVPMAMPTCARASAGASLMPSPAIATRRPSDLQALDDAGLVGGLHLGDHFVDLRLFATASAVPRASPVSMTMRSPSARSACERGGRGVLDRDRRPRWRPRARHRRRGTSPCGPLRAVRRLVTCSACESTRRHPASGRHCRARCAGRCDCRSHPCR